MSYYDEIEIEDFDYDEDLETYFYPCPCGDKFQITKEELMDGEEEARCPSCSLVLRVIYDRDDFARDDDEDGGVVTFAATEPVSA
ncbi:Diphthamide biosynthesis protein 3 [Sorochytrium milnesiophthora]